MFIDAPTINECIIEFMNFIGNSILIGYNVNFDINFIYDNMIQCLGKPLLNNYIDVMRIARKKLSNLKHHRQSDIAEYFAFQLIVPIGRYLVAKYVIIVLYYLKII